MPTRPDPAALRAAFDAEWERARDALRAHDLDAAFARLERAHILGQRATARHVRTHVEMLRIGWRRRDAREVLGQLPRIVAAALFSWLWVPLGNPGGANVGALRSMPVPDDLRAVLGLPPAD